MAKVKKKHSKKDKASEDLLDAAAQSLKKFRKVTKQLSKLSTGQKLVGGLALAAAGLAYLATREPHTASDGAVAEPDQLREPEADAHRGRKNRRNLPAQSE